MKPIEKTAEARGPAIGASALAASAAVLMVTGPFRPIVDDVETMMANIASVLTSMPTNTSTRERNSLVPAFLGLRSGSGFDASLVPVSARISSMRCALCQKNMYGEIVVPKTATRRPMEFHVHVIRSPSVPAPTSCQGTRATKRTPTYPSSTKHNHLKILASRSNDPHTSPAVSVAPAIAAQRWSGPRPRSSMPEPVSYTHLRAHETRHELVCRLLL